MTWLCAFSYSFSPFSYSAFSSNERSPRQLPQAVASTCSGGKDREPISLLALSLFGRKMASEWPLLKVYPLSRSLSSNSELRVLTPPDSNRKYVVVRRFTKAAPGKGWNMEYVCLTPSEVNCMLEAFNCMHSPSLTSPSRTFKMEPLGGSYRLTLEVQRDEYKKFTEYIFTPKEIKAVRECQTDLRERFEE